MPFRAEDLELAIGAHRLHAVRFGSSTAPLVLGIHGLTGDGTQLATIGDALGSQSLQLVAPDLRGRGRSAPTGHGTYGWTGHARDLLGIADALGAARCALVGVSMGGSIAMRAAELDGPRMSALVLVDIAGRVDPGIGPVVEAAIAASTADPVAVAEDRAETKAHDPYDRWRHLTMPTLLLRATREMEPGAGFVVPADDRDRFQREVPHALVHEVVADHRTIADHPDAVAAIRAFLLEHAPG